MPGSSDGLRYVTLPGGVRPVAPLSPAVIAGDLVFVSGQIGNDPETRQLVAGGVAEQTHAVFRNLRIILEEAGSSLEHVVKTGVFLADRQDFGAFNTIYREYFPAPDLPARTTIESGFMVDGILVEIDCVAAVIR
jgi:2-iminobutanoate/2-iminopropanoate deaminase